MYTQTEREDGGWKLPDSDSRIKQMTLLNLAHSAYSLLRFHSFRDTSSQRQIIHIWDDSLLLRKSNEMQLIADSCFEYIDMYNRLNNRFLMFQTHIIIIYIIYGISLEIF